MRFYGAIGFAESVERAPVGSGIYEDVITERNLHGEVLRATRTQLEGDKVNPDISVSVRIRILPDSYTDEHLDAIRYITWKGRRRLISTMEPDPPRLIVTPGGVYNGPTPAIPDPPGDTGG